MKSSEECFEAFRQIKNDLPKYPLESQTEADTRARLIDHLLSEVLDWPPENVRRGEHRRIAVLEAKKSGDTFQLPKDITSGKPFTLNGIISKVANLQQYINQVTNYCFNNS
jgi:hypothetical protein